jgi:hypothetical protein
MPEYSPGEDAETLYREIGNRQPQSQRLHRHMFNSLRQRFGDRLAIVQLDIVPKSYRESFNLYTSWALDDGALSKLDQSFELTWSLASSCLLDQWNALAAGKSLPCEDPMLRPPLD